MKFRFLLLFFILQFSCYQVKSESSYKISLLTYSPGKEIYSTFGHSAIRVQNIYTNTDFVYNYGTFDFDTPGFYAKFIKGKLPYRLSRVSTEYVIQSTALENRSIIENELLLTTKENYLLVRILEENYLPENRSYLYDFFYDNCATKILHIVDSATNGRFEMSLNDYSPIAFNKLTKQLLNNHKWAKLGVNIAMGIHGQKKASAKETSFLPDYLLSLIIEANDPLSQVPLAGKGETILKAYPTRHFKSFQLSPLTVFVVILILTILLTIIERKIKKTYWIIDAIIIGLPVLTGIILSAFWIISDHYTYAWNHTILWSNPLFILHFNRKFKGTRIFIIFAITSLALGLISSLACDQSATIILIILTISLRITLYNRKG